MSIPHGTLRGEVSLPVLIHVMLMLFVMPLHPRFILPASSLAPFPFVGLPTPISQLHTAKLPSFVARPLHVVYPRQLISCPVAQPALAHRAARGDLAVAHIVL